MGRVTFWVTLSLCEQNIFRKSKEIPNGALESKCVEDTWIPLVQPSNYLLPPAVDVLLSSDMLRHSKTQSNPSVSLVQSPKSVQTTEVLLTSHELRKN
eukprot:1362697-Pyramimonas_sp.AAC.2